jgi:hypothetical protein
MFIKHLFLLFCLCLALNKCQAGGGANKNTAKPAPLVSVSVVDLGEVNVRFSQTIQKLSNDAKVTNKFTSNPAVALPNSNGEDRPMKLLLVKLGYPTNYPSVVASLQSYGYEPAPLHALMTLALNRPDLFKAHDVVWVHDLPTDASRAVWGGYMTYQPFQGLTLEDRLAAKGWTKEAWFLVTIPKAKPDP